jgi:predicted DNA-binding transcriptional regulator AlpA
MENTSVETVLFSLPLARLEPIFKSWVKDVILEYSPRPHTTNIIKAVDPDPWMTVPELIEYLPEHPHKFTVYKWVREATIPVNKSSKQLRFLKSEIDAWIKSGRRKTYAELRAEISPRRASR